MHKNKNGLHQQDRTNIKLPRRGFTLVEMLVSVALVVLMMVLFAQIFQSATGAMTIQKGIATNDQTSRFAMMIIRNDIRMRTFRDIVPFSPFPSHKTAAFYHSPNEQRAGYWEIDEGDPNDSTDDVLQFTVLTTIPKKLDASKTELPEFVGFATLLQKLNTPGPALSNQPEIDDGKIQFNNAGLSQAAEVCYFLRGKTLYRRVLLIRQPYVMSGLFNEPGADILPPGEDYDIGHVDAGSGGIGTFWHDFDYSAYYRTGTGPIFHNWDVAKDNQHSGATLINATSLGFPQLRFGHSISRPDGTPLSKIGANYIGRYTLRETADPNFGYPGRIPATPLGDPYNATYANGLTLNADNVVTPFSSINRRGEDILMKNVLEFDIKVWDDGLTPPKFVDLGNGNTNGYYGVANPTSTYGNRYDTWHPDFPADVGPDGQPGVAGIDDDGINGVDDLGELGFPGTDDIRPSPFRPVTTGADGANGALGVDDDGINGPNDPGELGYPGTDDEIPLKAIQITIRFIDPKTQITRQLTIVESLVDR